MNISDLNEDITESEEESKEYRVARQKRGWNDGWQAFINGESSDALIPSFKRIMGPLYCRGWEMGFFDAEQELEDRPLEGDENE